MSEILPCPIPSQAAEATTPIPNNNDPAQEEKRSAEEIEKEKTKRRQRTRQLNRNNYHAFLQFDLPPDTNSRFCQAHTHCKFEEPLVRSRYRVCLHGARRTYYHPECFEDRHDVYFMIPKHFHMDDPEMCGLMIHKWFEHNRLVDLDAIAEYILQDCLYRLGMLEPDQPMPELKDYTTEPENRCSLKDLVDNPMCGCFRKKALALAGEGSPTRMLVGSEME
ncbi:hypothetical protein BHE90_004159 [Fusarium euwallaceae]|uniref:Uncharacterized protein n=1 Tax=Fusarium euwallaceae TaxID=1147111 RepID=A0A430M076_9HYPO|nr:hypothetical protein BHE90_004159 [Fusarium euwallaceae]